MAVGDRSLCQALGVSQALVAEIKAEATITDGSTKYEARRVSGCSGERSMCS